MVRRGNRTQLAASMVAHSSAQLSAASLSKPNVLAVASHRHHHGDEARHKRPREDSGQSCRTCCRRLSISLDPPMRSLGVTVSASLGSFVALCLGWVCRIRRCARLFHCGFLVVPVLGGWSARGEGGWAERCGVERVELVLPGPAGG